MKQVSNSYSGDRKGFWHARAHRTTCHIYKQRLCALPDAVICDKVTATEFYNAMHDTSIDRLRLARYSSAMRYYIIYAEL